MNLYLVSQSASTGYDTYDSFVVACNNEKEASETSPVNHYIWTNNQWFFVYYDGIREPSSHNSWCHPTDVTVKYIGIASEGVVGVVCSSFNAG